MAKQAKKERGAAKNVTPLFKGPALVTHSDELPLERPLLLRLHELMVKARALEERLIAMYKSGHGYFWIGGPGEEAFNVPLGPADQEGRRARTSTTCHFHYRQSGTLLAMGEEPIGALRQMKNTATDPYSGGRNFAGHFSMKEWNVTPVSSPIEVQYAIAIGHRPGPEAPRRRRHHHRHRRRRRHRRGRLRQRLVWASRPGQELPLLIIVTNNHWGISTPYASQHGEARISDRGAPSACAPRPSTATTRSAPTSS